MGNGNLVFFGTPEICIPFLDQLSKQFSIGLIITQPDSIGGRKKQTIVPAVKSYALDNKIEFLQPEKLKAPEVINTITEMKPLIGVVVSYGKIIPGSVFSIPKFNTVNVHFSLLPSFRGAAPVQRVIESGAIKTGITIFEINKKMDAGSIWAQKKIVIQKDETSPQLLHKLCQAGAPLLTETLKKITNNSIEKTPQHDSQATYARAVGKSEGVIDWTKTAQQIYNLFRAFTPWPGISFCLMNINFKLTRIKVSESGHSANPGDIISLTQEGLKVGCGYNSVLDIIEFQPQCKKSMTPYCYSLGNKITSPLGLD